MTALTQAQRSASFRTRQAAKMKRMETALRLWIAYDNIDVEDFSGIDPMLAYSNALEATRNALSPQSGEEG